MVKNLVIVESPAKAKTIEKFLGKDFVVKSCFGHIRDLPQKDFGVDVKNDFLPKYVVSADKKQVIDELKKIAETAETVWLATDEDREGEAISWHLADVLGLDEKTTKRIVFHEITKTAITAAIEKPRIINRSLVDAQQARRVLDRLVGFEISPILWKKVKPALSAGRVQSVAVRLIVEREQEIKKFVSTSSYKIQGLFNVNGDQIKAELRKRYDTKDESLSFLKDAKSANFKIEDIETKPSKKSPAAPFTTSTIQQEASRKLGFSVAKTMLIAQQLYESGLITYMRTDSVNLSDLALQAAKEEITRTFGAEYVNTKNYVTKTKGAQESHEAIRPTYFEQSEVEGTNDQKRLYELIWKRTIASQMADVKIEKTTATIDISTRSDNKFVARGEVVKFDGFLKVYMEGTDDEDEEQQEGILPAIKVGDVLKSIEILATERYTQHPPRYTEASLVKKLEELGIGRPSTYAPTISTIQKREYVVNETRPGYERKYDVLTLKQENIIEEVKLEITGSEKYKLFPTDIGSIVNDFLISYFENILDYNFTANVEKEFDEIANGNKVWNTMIRDFYGTFHNQVEETLQNAKKTSGERILGDDPESNRPISVKIGRFGPIAQIGESSDTDKPKFASLKKGQSLESITLEEALELFKLPRVAGEYEGEEMVVAVGRFGPYVRHNSAFYSLKKTDDPLEVDETRCIEIIEEKRQKDKEKVIKEFSENKDVLVLKGRWGAYIAAKGKNYRIPKDVDPKKLTIESCENIINESKEKPVKSKKK